MRATYLLLALGLAFFVNASTIEDRVKKIVIEQLGVAQTEVLSILTCPHCYY
jgi:hypothetical protein